MLCHPRACAILTLHAPGRWGGPGPAPLRAFTAWLPAPPRPHPPAHPVAPGLAAGPLALARVHVCSVLCAPGPQGAASGPGHQGALGQPARAPRARARVCACARAPRVRALRSLSGVSVSVALPWPVHRVLLTQEPEPLVRALL